MAELATSRRTGFHTLTNLWHARRARIKWILLPVLPGALLYVLITGAPFVLWAYNIHQAGKALTLGLAWPTPRLADSLPEVRNPDELQTALGHLAAARRWQPERAYAYRLAGQIYAAQHDWLRAVHEYEQARKRDPKHPLLAWESALLYEQMQQRIETAPRETLLSKLISAPRESQDLPQGSASCWGDQPNTCFMGLETWNKPYAAAPSGLPATYDVLVMHAPGGIRLTHTINTSHPGLSFLLGLDPNVSGGQSDGATYRILIETAQGSQQIYERALDRATADQGWIPDMVDLSPWAGQTVTLIFRLDGGPAGDTRDDWYGWGNVLLTTTEVARLVTYTPAARWQMALRHINNDASRFIKQGDLMLEAGAYERAVLWYQRAAAIEALPPSLQFRNAIASIAAQMPMPRHVDLQMITIHTFTQDLQVEAETLQWLIQRPRAGITFGDPLQKAPSADPTTGTLWWDGAAVTLIQVPQTGTYRVTLKARHTGPAPIKLQLEHNLQPLGRFSLNREDQSWELLEVTTFLEAGIHCIGVRFLNDGEIRGIDRNAVVDWIRLQLRK